MFLKNLFASIFNMNYINDIIDLMEKGMLEDSQNFNEVIVEDNSQLYTIVTVK